MIKMVQFVVKCLANGAFDFKILKNLDFVGGSKYQKLFNRNLFKVILTDLNSEKVNKFIKKMFGNDKKLLFADELKSYAERYERLYFAKDFEGEAQHAKATLSLDYFKNLR